MCLAVPGQIMEVVDEANRLAGGRRRRPPNVNIGLLDGERLAASAPATGC